MNAGAIAAVRKEFEGPNDKLNFKALGVIQTIKSSSPAIPDNMVEKELT